MKFFLLVGLLFALLLPSPNPMSDAYQVGYAEGRMDLAIETTALDRFYVCVANGKKKPQACWDDQIAWTKLLYETWDEMGDKEKIAHVEKNYGGKKWADTLRGRGDRTALPPLPSTPAP